MSIVESDGLPSWSLDLSETGESTKCPWVGVVGARQLLDKIKEHRDVFNWNKKGELLYENKPITGSHVVDLVNDMLRHRKGFEPVGWSVFCERSGTNEYF